MASLWTLENADQAIANLDYRRKDALPARLVSTIRQFYRDEYSVESLKEIKSEVLVKVLWHAVDDPAEAAKKRKQLSTIKSRVNGDLRGLYKEGKNPGGIVIGRSNIFVMCDEAKDKALQALHRNNQADEAISLEQIADILRLANDLLSKQGAFADSEGSEGGTTSDQIQRLILGLSEKIGLGAMRETDSSAERTALPDVQETEAEPDAAKLNGDYEDLTEVIEEDRVEEEAAPLNEDFQEEEGILDEVPEIEETGNSVEEEAIDNLRDVEIDDTLREIKDGLVLQEATGGDDLEENEDAELQGYQEATGGAYDEDDEIRKARLLAEEFNNLLGAREKYYNQYILILEGEYVVGSRQPKRDEKPKLTVHLNPFYAGKFPVTNALFEVFVEKTGYRTTAEKRGYGTVYCGRCQKRVDAKTGLPTVIWNSALIRRTIEGACWYQPSGPGSTIHTKRNHPVVQVTLEDAMAFAAWTGKRIPTEDEWEAASRTAQGCIFPWGNDWRKNAGNIKESSIGDTTPVDGYISFANEFEIADTMGNVWEWTADRFEPSSYARHESRLYICKGGSWVTENEIRLFSRFLSEPESSSNITGFRCVAD